MPSRESLIVHIRGEYREMPGLRLTLAQACGLWHVDAATCETVLEQLVREALLHRTDDGAYVALSSGARQPAKAQLRSPSKGARPQARAVTAMADSRALSWLYTRGAQSVRLVREEHLNGCHLVVHGPGPEIVTHEFFNLAECMPRQADIEATLQATGFQLDTTSSDRRRRRQPWHGVDRLWHGADHRRAAS
jgi:hypothetical protein